MFSLLWRFFPGPAWVRVIVLVLVAAVLVWAIVTYLYPWIATMLTGDEVTVTE